MLYCDMLVTIIVIIVAMRTEVTRNCIHNSKGAVCRIKDSFFSDMEYNYLRMSRAYLQKKWALFCHVSPPLFPQ